MNPHNTANDTQAPRVLISENFVYWGGGGPDVPDDFRDYSGIDICLGGQGYKVNFPEELVTDFDQWISGVSEKGYRGEPLDWIRTN